MRTISHARFLAIAGLMAVGGAGPVNAQPEQQPTPVPRTERTEPVELTRPAEPGEPVLTGVDAPERFELGNPNDLTLLVGIETENLSPLLDAEIFVRVFDMWGKPIEVPVLNTLSARDILYGDKLIGIDIGHALQYRGERFSVKICAYSKQITGKPCSVVDLYDRGSPLDEPVKDQKILIDLVKKRFPGIGCRCKSGVIRLSAKDTSHGSLGKFTAVTGGPNYGPYHATDKVKKLINSNFKFEPHFEIEILNRPDKPKGMDAEIWSLYEKMFPSLCTEGQRVNGTTVFNAGTPAKREYDVKETVGGNTVKKPYTETKDTSKFTWDAHGYRVPGTGRRTVTGDVKAHEKNIVHWLDTPGLNQKDQSHFVGLGPAYANNFFHSFVHGTTGKDADNCDCFFGVQTGVVDANADAQAPKILKKPECK
ncbi:hypothetical protein [Roseibium aggregatum]|uniref:Uncharacterized protein n=1 Tax=Roseibium aggregatum TaxID=187304 RepID=A0A926NTW4_9HYPH|nr:hypothetical protein [Roseibium aggregatum]MBD1545144.1 hypothetical protein [Roseibium aggregatum]